MRRADVPTEPSQWPAPPPFGPSAQQRPTGTAAMLVGVVGSLVGATTFGIVWIASNITLNTCRYGGFDGTVDVCRARLWLSVATVLWVAMPLIAGALAKGAGRNVPIWHVIALTFALAGSWAVVDLGPWELCV